MSDNLTEVSDCLEAPAFEILLVDDDPDVLALLEFSFRSRTGWTVTSAASASSAVTVLEHPTAIDVVLTDDELGGVGVVQLRAAAGPRPVVLLSTSLDAPASMLASAPGFAGVIGKPFDPIATPDLLAQVVRNWSQRI